MKYMEFDYKRIRHDKKLKDFTYRLLSEIFYLSDGYDCSAKNNKYFTDIFSCSIVTIQKALKELKDNKYIHISFIKPSLNEVIRFIYILNKCYK